MNLPCHASKEDQRSITRPEGIAEVESRNAIALVSPSVEGKIDRQLIAQSNEGISLMLKKIGFVTAGVAAGMVMLSGFASAEGSDYPGWNHGDEGNDQVGLVNVNNVDALHNVNVNAGVCDNNVNVLGVQVPVEDALNGIGVPILSPGEHDAEAASPENCASASLEDGGSVQDN
jgi:hypothetical protein